MKRALKYVQLATNVAIVSVCALLAWSVLTHKTVLLKTSKSESETSAPPLINATWPPFSKYKWDSHSETLVLAIRKGCPYCQASLPFYKRLSDLEKDNKLRAHILVVMPDDKDSGTAEMTASGISVDGIYSESLESLKIQGTPTFLLIDATGRINRAWVGQLLSKDEKQVIEAASSSLSQN